MGEFAGAAPKQLEVIGLFKDRAFLRTPGGDIMLRVGDTRDGVHLVAATAQHAIVAYNGDRQTLSLSQRIGTEFHREKQQQLVLNADRYGQYRVTGLINNRPATLLVDTGATVVAMSSKTATELGIDYEARGKVASVVTASGVARSHMLTLDAVTVGSLTRRDVRAAVVEGDYPVDILLGMSFLRDVSIREADGVMRLGAVDR